MGDPKRRIYPPVTVVPDKVPVFPLPNAILFPEVELPLYIFEPRYRRMLSDCSRGNKFMAVSLFRRGWEGKAEPIPSHDVVGVGFVRAIFENPDGTSHILLKGVGRARIVRYTHFEPYRVARIQMIPDEIEDEAEFEELFRQLKRLLMQKLRLTSEKPHTPLRFPKEFKDPVALSHLACFFTDSNPYLKQDLLETTGCNQRMRQLINLLEEEILPHSNHN